MLNLYQKIQKIESLQAEADRATASFKKRYHVDCIEHCAECCKYSQIEANPLEFLPLAWHYYKIGQLEQLFDRVSNWDGAQCVFSVLDKDKWGCSVYPTRGMICRLFGFSSVMDKTGKPNFACCHTLKVAQPEKMKCICERVHSSGKTSIISNFYQRLSDIDFGFEQEMVPINQAIKEACEIVFNHVGYK